MQISKIFITTSTVSSASGQRPVNFTFDCVMEYSPTFKRAISSYPVSTKSNLADHIFNENDTLRLTGAISASPLVLAENSMVKPEMGLGRLQQAYEELKRLGELSEPITLVSEFDIIDNLYITEITPVQDNNMILFTITFEQQFFASYKSVTIVRHMSKNLAAENGTGGKKVEWGYNEKGEWVQQDKATGMEIVDPEASAGKKFNTIMNNFNKLFSDTADKLTADPVAPKL